MSTHIINEPTASVNSPILAPMLTALNDAERALWPEGRTLCAPCGTFGEMCLLTAALEDEGRYVVPVACGVCGGWRVEDEKPTLMTGGADYVLRTYPGAVYCRWDDLIGGYAPITAPYCVLTHKDGYAVHAVLDNGTLGALIERVRL